MNQEEEPLLIKNYQTESLFNDSREKEKLYKINRNIKIGFGLIFTGILIIIILLIVGLVRANSTLNEIDKVNLTAIEETASTINQIMANNGTEKIILFLNSIDPDTIEIYMLKVKNIIDEACTYFFRC